MNLNAPPSSFAIDQSFEDCDQPYPRLFGSNIQTVASSPSSVSCHVFLSSSQDHTGYYHHQHTQPGPQEDDNHGGSSSYEIKNKGECSSLKLTLWKKESAHDHDHSPDHMLKNEKDTNNTVKWMSSKMRLMQKMKNNPDRRASIINTNKLEVSSSSFETDHHFNSNNNPIRVCGDCSTTQTPLWRSGPKGPKSLCNACGIRQRKARRALAAATNNGTGVTNDRTTASTALKIKLVNKEKNNISKHEFATPLKKRYKMAASSSSTTTAGSKPNGQRIEDFLMNFSKKLGFHRVFPEDEKDAAILLMALSSGLIHG